MIGAALIALAIAGLSPPPPAIQTESEAGGMHIRVETARGPIHIFSPPGYDRRTAGLVVYVHGLYVHVDQAWQEHHLAQQFAASRQNALFIAPEAPAAPEEEPLWDRLGSLIATALRRAHLRPPRGPVVAIGHSGAYRTLVPWLSEPSLRHLVLVDAMYGNEDEFRIWLNGGRGRKMTLVVKGTARRADPFVRSFRRAITMAQIPASFDALSPAERSAKLLYLRSQYGHFELITEGQTLPVLIQRTGLRPVRTAAAGPPPVVVGASASQGGQGDPGQPNDGGVRE